MSDDLHRPWWALGVLALLVAVAFGSLFYAYSVLITEEAAGADFSTTVLSSAYGGFVLVGGLLAVVVGRIADRRGIRPIVAVGVVLGVAGLWVLSAAREPWQVIGASWFLLGPAGSMLFYEPAFVAVDQWFGSSRARAIAVLTLIGGLAGPVFLPLTGALVSASGWRTTARILAVGLAAFGAAAIVFIPRSRPRSETAGGGARPRLANLIRQPRFLWFTAAIVLLYGTMQAVFFHRIAVFEEAGFAVAAAAAWAGIAGLCSFPGRYLAPVLVDRRTAAPTQAALAGVLAASVVVMVMASATWSMALHFVLFGLAFGAALPLRAVIMGDWYSGPAYGSIMGAQWSSAAVVGAAGPWLVGVARDGTGGYDGPMLVVAALLAVAGVVTLIAVRRPALPVDDPGAQPEA